MREQYGTNKNKKIQGHKNSKNTEKKKFGGCDFILTPDFS